LVDSKYSSGLSFTAPL